VHGIPLRIFRCAGLVTIEEIREEITKLLEFSENEDITHQNLWDSKGSDKGKVYCHETYI
jgi:hypothetical protein